jgi:hypothetical protein
MWLKMRQVAQTKLAAGANGSTAYYETKIATARFFVERMLPEVDSRLKSLKAGSATIMSLPAEQF